VSEPIVTRLRDVEAAPGSVEAEGVELLQSRERREPTAAAKTRVRAALEARARGGATPARWRPALVAGVLVVGLAASGVSFGRQWVGEGYRRLMIWIQPLSRPPEEAPPPRPARAAPAAPSDVVLVEPLSPPPVAPAPVREHARASRVEAPRARVPASRPIPVVDDEPTLVATAMRALRHDHDAELAAGLLDDYLRRWPNGALIEEALALAIEAANARGDARARVFAAEYVGRFPSGRFGEAARRTLARPAP
jgi:hypothetical protein